MKTLSAYDMNKLGACYELSKIRQLFGGKELNALEILALPIPALDKIWGACRTQLISLETIRAFERWCVKHTIFEFDEWRLGVSDKVREAAKVCLSKNPIVQEINRARNSLTIVTSRFILDDVVFQALESIRYPFYDSENPSYAVAEAMVEVFDIYGVLPKSTTGSLMCSKLRRLIRDKES